MASPAAGLFIKRNAPPGLVGQLILGMERSRHERRPLAGYRTLSPAGRPARLEAAPEA